MSTLDRWPSVESASTDLPIFERVPEMTEFKFKLVDKLGNTLDMLKYKLKEGRELPCRVNLKGTYFL